MRALLLPVLLLACAPAGARDLGQWGQVDPKIRACFHNLKSPAGGMCCDGADGIHIEDPDWHQNADGSYTVHIDGVDQRIDAGHMTDAAPCGAEYAIAWTYWETVNSNTHRQVRCFSPGPRS